MKPTSVKSGAALLTTIILVAATQIHGSQRQATPLTAEIEETFYKPDGQFSKVQRSIVAVRSDGSHLEIVFGAAPDGRPVQQTRLLDVPAARRLVADELTKSLTTYELKPAAVESYRIQGGTCHADADSERRTLLSHEALRLTKQHGEDRGAGIRLSSESWIAVKLNCLPLQETILATQAGNSPRVTSVRQVKSVVVGEPNASLFEIPADLIERSPSAVMAEYERLVPRDRQSSAVANASQHLDPPYYNNRNK